MTFVLKSGNVDDKLRLILTSKLQTGTWSGGYERWMEQTYSTVLPKSLMGKAIAYSYSMWGRMKNYLLDGRLEIDNNGAENAVRPIALSRKNFLFCGNHRSAGDTAVICSLLASCKELGANPRQYLTDILSRLPYCNPPTKYLFEVLR